MRRLRFKILITLSFLVSCHLYPQKLKLHHKELDVNNLVETKVYLDLDNVAFIVDKSLDDKLHIDCELEFINHSKAEVEEVMKGLTISSEFNDNVVSIKAASIKSIASVSYSIDDDIVIKGVSSMEVPQKKKQAHKSKDSITKEINEESIRTWEFLNEAFRFEDQNGKEKKLSIENVRILKSRFILRIPSNIKLFIKGTETKIKLKGRMSNEMDMNVKGGSIKAEVLENRYNKVKMDDVDFKVGAIKGGEYIISNVSDVLIGSIENSKITSELSKMQIGEIQSNVSIEDYNSTLWLYNFSNDFKRFDLTSEYSKVHFFYPETNYGLKVFGHNTVNYVGGLTVSMNPTKKEEKGLMMSKGVKEDEAISGQIQFDMTHSIIHSYNDSKPEINKHQKQ